MYEELPENNPVYNLQTMLRTLSFYYPKLIRLIPNGIYDEKTQEAVMIFQREFGLSVTGTVDNATWDAIVLAWSVVEERMGQSRGVSNLPNWNYTIPPGQASVYLLLTQALFKALSTVLEEIESCPVDGMNSGACTRNVRWLQRKGNLQENGILGKAEWDLLTRLYDIFLLWGPEAGRKKQPSQGENLHRR